MKMDVKEAVAWGLMLMGTSKKQKRILPLYILVQSFPFNQPARGKKTSILGNGLGKRSVTP